MASMYKKMLDALAEKYPDSGPYTCEYCYDQGLDLYSMIVHLNDEHEISRERIADWVDSL